MTGAAPRRSGCGIYRPSCPTKPPGPETQWSLDQKLWMMVYAHQSPPPPTSTHNSQLRSQRDGDGPDTSYHTIGGF
jgi:hypothetical protein